MKVGIITFHRAHNVGAMLQTYALQEYIKSLGLQVEIIDYYNPKVYAQYEIFSLLLYNRIRKHDVIRLFRTLASRLYNLRARYKKKKLFSEFMESHLALSKIKYLNAEDLSTYCLDYDAYICGSDQIWNREITGGLDPAYFLYFSDNKRGKAIAYGASLGKDTFAPDDVEEFSKYLNNLDYISVREKTAIRVLQSICDKPIENVLDPTLLLSWQQWAKVLIEPDPKEQYILVYEMEYNTELVDIVNRLSESENLRVIHFVNRRRFKREKVRYPTVKPFEFIGLIGNARYVVTNSFHGTVFSILSSRDFVTIPHSTSGSRMIDLLETLGLSDRVAYSSNDVEKILVPIDYVEVNKKLDLERQRSLDFLKRALEE